ncbi:sigma 54-interacting transcriptional regulator [Clostridium sp. AN503]|uniref:sigma-54 interaction domain-containing protein n=1 Tax=Clostridium sp. AN503 TaxID=3160598 RepID=UPI00345A794D
MSRCIEIAQKYSQYDSSILIEGESGVGKELFAQSIHNASARKNKPFVAVNCAALSKSLIESELFGYAEGAFTGARKGGKEGMFELAHRGTIFLDEISELPLDVQGQLLRVLQEREVIRIGDSKVTPLDIRIICATNKNLNQMVKEGAFRQDLLYRINTLRLTIPKLNERREDVKILAEMFVKHFAEKYGKDVFRISPAALHYLAQYDFRGNVRELRGMIERAVILTETRTITEDELNLDLSRLEAAPQTPSFDPQDSYTLSLKEVETQYIQKIWNQEENSVAKTCDILKINRTTLWRKLKEINTTL